MNKYQEADIWLAEQMGECVHDWKLALPGLSGVSGGKNLYRCTKCDVTKMSHITPPICIPRSKDLGAMVNVAVRLKLDYRLWVDEKYAVVDEFEKDWEGNSEILNEQLVKDHETPQHAAAWAIYLALRAVKR